MSDITLAGERVVGRFRVAREGQTVDGRTLSAQDLYDIATTYNPTEYTARINTEHTGGWFGLNSDSYPILGDVVACEYVIEPFTIDGQVVNLGCLYATLSALPALVEANRQGKKLFTSIEYYKNFAGTGKAYLVGLAVTDTPASRGVEPLKFSHTSPQTQHSAPLAMEIIMTDTTTPETLSTTTQPKVPPAPKDPETPKEQGASDDGFLAKMSALFNASKGLNSEEQDAIFKGFEVLTAQNKQTNQTIQALQTALENLSCELAHLKEHLASQTVATEIPLATGGDITLTEF